MLPQSNANGPRGAILPYCKGVFGTILTIQKLRHYLQHHHTKLIFKADHLKYIFNQPNLNERHKNWLKQNELQNETTSKKENKERLKQII